MHARTGRHAFEMRHAAQAVTMNVKELGFWRE